MKMTMTKKDKRNSQAVRSVVSDIESKNDTSVTNTMAVSRKRVTLRDIHVTQKEGTQ